MQGFIGQEATHRRLHALFNGHLEKLGLVNDWEPRAAARLKQMEGEDVRHWLGITAANEHFTAIFADFMLHNPDLLDGADPRLKTLWLWHSAEESEHKSTAFDLYQALGGSHEWRVKWMRRVTFFFLTTRCARPRATSGSDGTLWKWSTWKSAASYLFGRRGLVRQTYGPGANTSAGTSIRTSRIRLRRRAGCSEHSDQLRPSARNRHSRGGGNPRRKNAGALGPRLRGDDD